MVYGGIVISDDEYQPNIDNWGHDMMVWGGIVISDDEYVCSLLTSQNETQEDMTIMTKGLYTFKNIKEHVQNT